ncbi:hypothetical protein EL17_22790 [Anditalea andensis]|uniref:Uncharacterized protein n=1 Tax=Anditalea andensis TaxID=1048983 RepID=A0A074LPJ5_9BACT|nr:hypothetical protein EL17_22790 [Anditalea andensis]
MFNNRGRNRFQRELTFALNVDYLTMVNKALSLKAYYLLTILGYYLIGFCFSWRHNSPDK